MLRSGKRGRSHRGQVSAEDKIVQHGRAVFDVGVESIFSPPGLGTGLDRSRLVLCLDFIVGDTVIEGAIAQGVVVLLRQSNGDIALETVVFAIGGLVSEGVIVLAVGDGFVQVTGDRVAILTDMAIKAADIDEAKAEEARQRAEARLAEKITGEDAAMVNAALVNSLAQLKVKRRTHR